MNQEQLPLLVAHRADILTVQAAEELVKLEEDKSVPAHEGKELPKADEAARRLWERTHEDSGPGSICMELG